MNNAATLEKKPKATKKALKKPRVLKDETPLNKAKEAKIVIKKDLQEAFTKALQEIPEGRIPEFIDMIQAFTENAKHEPIKPLPTNKDQLKDAGIELYPDFKKRTGEANGLKCLQENWGHWLKAYTPALDRDYMCQADLKKLDPKLLIRLKDTMDKNELDKYIPSKPSLNKQIAKLMTEKEKREAYKKQFLANKTLEAA
jgi:hypothetical protein